MDKETTIKEFLEFRSKFTKREWHELNQAIDERLKQKADQLKLDDSDLVAISDKLKRFIKGDLIKAGNISAKDIDSTKLKTDFC